MFIKNSKFRCISWELTEDTSSYASPGLNELILFYTGLQLSLQVKTTYMAQQSIHFTLEIERDGPHYLLRKEKPTLMHKLVASG